MNKQNHIDRHIDRSDIVDGIWIIHGYSKKETVERAMTIERERQDAHRPIEIIPLTLEQEKHRWEKTAWRERKQEKRDGKNYE